MRILQDNSRRSFALAVAILKYYLGMRWIEQHAGDKSPLEGIFRQRFDNAVKGEIQSFQLVDLSELLYNLQNVSGFDECIDRLKQGNIEGPLAELDFGRMLTFNGIRFRFVIPIGTKGNDYDIRIEMSDGTEICADAKCKIATTEFSEATVRNSLQDARTQFPNDRPSIIFVKVPSRWLTELDKGLELRDIAARFLRGTGRIVSVAFYTSGLEYRDKVMSHVHAFDEVANPNNRFDATRNWRLSNSTPSHLKGSLAAHSLFSQRGQRHRNEWIMLDFLDVTTAIRLPRLVAASRKPQATSHKPQATSHKPQATSHKPQATSFRGRDSIRILAPTSRPPLMPRRLKKPWNGR